MTLFAQYIFSRGTNTNLRPHPATCTHMLPVALNAWLLARRDLTHLNLEDTRSTAATEPQCKVPAHAMYSKLLDI